LCTTLYVVDCVLSCFLPLITLCPIFFCLLRFSPLIALYPDLFRTLPFNRLSFAYCVLSRFPLVIFALPRFNSLYVAYLVLSRFSCFALLLPALARVNLFYRALPCFTCFKLLFHRFTLLLPHVSLYPLSCPFLHSFHLLFFMPAFLFSPSLSFYAPLCQTSPRLQTYAQLAPISYPYAQLIRFSLFLPFPPPYVPLPYHFCPAYIISIFIMLPKISLTFSNIFKIVCLYPMYMLNPVCETWVFRFLVLSNRVFRIRVFDDRVF